MSDTKTLAIKLVELAIATAGKEPDDAVLTVYLKHLSRFEASQVLAAIERLIVTAKFFPSVGEIIEAIEGDADFRAAMAWANPQHGDPVIEETVRLVGGWRMLTHTPYDKLPFVERRFIELYPHVEAKHRAGRLEPFAITASAGLRRIGRA